MILNFLLDLEEEQFRTDTVIELTSIHSLVYVSLCIVTLDQHATDDPYGTTVQN